MPVTLSEAARRLGLRDNREVSGIAKFLGIPLYRMGNFNAVLIKEEDLQRIKDEWNAMTNCN
jgi:hypothetical protein